MPTSTTRAELEELVEAPAAFTPETPATARYQDEQFTLLGRRGSTWLAAQARRRGAAARTRAARRVEHRTPALAVQAGSQSAPILARLGFEKVCQFRRLEDVASLA